MPGIGAGGKKGTECLPSLWSQRDQKGLPSLCLKQKCSFNAVLPVPRQQCYGERTKSKDVSSATSCFGGLHALGPTVPANTTSAGHQAVRDHGRNKTGLSWVGEWIGEGTGSMFSAGCTDKAKAPAPGFVLCIEGLPPCHPGVSGCCWPGHICIDVSICIAEKRRW